MRPQTFDQMDYAAFSANLLALKAAYPLAVDCTRTRFQAGAPLLLREQTLAQLALPARGHRCHGRRYPQQPYQPGVRGTGASESLPPRCLLAHAEDSNRLERAVSVTLLPGYGHA